MDTDEFGWQPWDDIKRHGKDWICSFVPGHLFATVHERPESGVFSWHVVDENRLDPEPGGACDTFEEAKFAAEEAAVAWFLILLAKRAERWCDQIDARLARDLRDASHRLAAAEYDHEALGGAYPCYEQEAEAKAYIALKQGYPFDE